MKLSVVDQSPISAGSTPADALRNSVDLATLAERLGYTRYWIAEHHAMRSLASTAPEILIARIGAATSAMRIGSGGVLLPYYAPLKVAESFRMLHALYGDRIDLGIGRAPGGGGWEVYALQRKPDPALGQDFVQQLLELRAFLKREFPAGHRYGEILVSPDMPGAPELWLLGSSPASAELAGRLGLPYAFAHFISQDHTRQAIEHYRARMAEVGLAPYVILAVGAIAADTKEEADRLFSTVRLFGRRLRRNDRRPVPSPEEALAELGEVSHEAPPRTEWPRYFRGTKEKVKADLDAMAEALKVDELMIVTITHSHAARRRSYELLAEAYGLEPRG